MRNSYFIVEELAITMKSGENDCRSKSILCVKSEEWQAQRYLKKIWTRFRDDCWEATVRYIDDNYAEFWTEGGFVTFYITEDPFAYED